MLTYTSLAKSPCCGVLLVLCSSVGTHKVSNHDVGPVRRSVLTGMSGKASSHREYGSCGARLGMNVSLAPLSGNDLLIHVS